LLRLFGSECGRPARALAGAASPASAPAVGGIGNALDRAARRPVSVLPVIPCKEIWTLGPSAAKALVRTSGRALILFTEYEPVMRPKGPRSSLPCHEGPDDAWAGHRRGG